MVDRLWLRVAQVVRFVRPGTIEVSPFHAYLTPEAATTFATLSSGDQQHALAVAQRLEANRSPSTLVTAGLLHDIGKAVPGVSVRISDRVAKVLLSKVAPNRLALMASWERPRWPLGGLWVLSRHARYGGELVRRWGYPERIAWLVEHHEDDEITDGELALLMAVDDGREADALASGIAHG